MLFRLTATTFLSLVLTATLHAQATQDLPDAVAKAAANSFHEYSGITFDDQIVRDAGKHQLIVVPKTFDPGPGAGVYTPNAPAPTHIGHLVFHSDFVGLGTPIKRWTIPTADNTFAVSIYLVHLSDIGLSKDESLKSNADIYIVRAGGTVSYGGHQFRTIDPDFHLFHLNEPYVFFGTKIAPNTYKVDSDRALEVHSNEVQEASESHRHAAVFKGKSPSDILRQSFAEWEQQSANDRKAK